MNHLSLALLLGLVALTLPAPGHAEPNAGKAAPVATNYLLVYRPGPNWPPGTPVSELPLKEHGQYMIELYRKGSMKFAGPLTDDAGGAVVLEVSDADEARAIVAADPAVTAGIFVGELHPWKMVDWEKFNAAPKASLPEPEAVAVLRELGPAFSRAVVDASASAWTATRVDALVSLYTDDAILFPPKGLPIEGKDAIRAYWTRTPDRKILAHAITVERAELSGDLLVDQGRLSLTAQQGEEAAQAGAATYISAWRRGEDGKWRKRLDSWW